MKTHRWLPRNNDIFECIDCGCRESGMRFTALRDDPCPARSETQNALSNPRPEGEIPTAEWGQCQLCGEPMPEGEEMFNYHGYSCPCPKPHKPREDTECLNLNCAKEKRLLNCLIEAQRLEFIKLREEKAALELKQKP